MVNETMIKVTKETRHELKALVVKKGLRSYEELFRHWLSKEAEN